METGKLFGFVLVAIVVVTLLRQYIPAYAMVVLVGCTVVFLAFFLHYAAPVIAWLKELSHFIDEEEFVCLLKAAAIALVAQSAQDLCKDAGMNSLATSVDFAGRCLILASALPLFQQVIERIGSLLT